MFPNEFPSIFDNQPFVLDLPTDMMKGDLIDQSTGKMIDIHDFLKLCYPKLSDKLMKMLEEEKKRRSNRKIFLQNKKNGPEIYDEYLVQN